ncbi:MAG: 30S ribosomal protein S21 [bacterium]|nr:30S ribosomal protein S21 [candidate division TA06 bacterium]MDO9026802.1 30S ribosomal protein S21 [bacterium]MDO9391575.1 30S ribosomal protein S21 [bacterium]
MRDSDSFEKALRIFKRKCIKEGLLADMRKGEFFSKPSVRKKVKSAKARSRKARFGM